MTKMTERQEALKAIIESDKLYLTPADVAPVLGIDPHSVRLTARQQPELIGFPFMFIGSRMKIPRIPFLRFMGAEDQAYTDSVRMLLDIYRQLFDLRKDLDKRLTDIEDRLMKYAEQVEPIIKQNTTNRDRR